MKGAIAAAVALFSTASIAEEPPRPTPQRVIPAAPFSEGVLARDFATMLDWLEGRWDNAEQVFFAAELGYPPADAPGRIHSVFARVALPWLGENVFYVEQYSDNDPAKVYRQRFYSFTIDRQAMAIRLDIHSPKDPAAVRGAHRDPGRLAGLDVGGLVGAPGCEVYWRREAAQFRGWMHDGACRVQSRQSGRTIVIEDDLVLSAEELWISDRAVDEAGAPVFGNRTGIPHRLRKAQEWSCWIAVPRQAPGQGWFFARDLKIHDQGGEVWIRTDEAAPREFGFRLRQVRWVEGTNADAVTLYALARGEERAISYAWADPQARRVGINLRTLQGSCTR